jgi:hypothetical protein
VCPRGNMVQPACEILSWPIRMGSKLPGLSLQDRQVPMQ